MDNILLFKKNEGPCHKTMDSDKFVIDTNAGVRKNWDPVSEPKKLPNINLILTFKFTN